MLFEEVINTPTDLRRSKNKIRSISAAGYVNNITTKHFREDVSLQKTKVLVNAPPSPQDEYILIYINRRYLSVMPINAYRPII